VEQNRVLFKQFAIGANICSNLPSISII
jgi:hypothetical protein